MYLQPIQSTDFDLLDVAFWIKLPRLRDCGADIFCPKFPREQCLHLVQRFRHSRVLVLPSQWVVLEQPTCSPQIILFQGTDLRLSRKDLHYVLRNLHFLLENLQLYIYKRTIVVPFLPGRAEPFVLALPRRDHDALKVRCQGDCLFLGY